MTRLVKINAFIFFFLIVIALLNAALNGFSVFNVIVFVTCTISMFMNTDKLLFYRGDK